MRTTFFASRALGVLSLAMLLVAHPRASYGQQAPESSTQVAQSQPAGESAIRRTAEAFGAAYNARDAKALAELFAPDAEIVNEQGQAVQGREAIQRVFAALFAAHPKSHMDIAIDSIRFVAPTVAVEDGITTVVHGAGEPAERNRYTVVHVRHGDTWQMASARDLPEEPSSAEEELKQLDWLIGEWVDESHGALVITSYQWSSDRHYIVGEFKVQVAGRPAMTGSHRIGWDPLVRQIRSWAFNSEGGFAQGAWTRKGNQWTAKMTGVTRDGKAASATNITTRVAKDRMTWQSRDQIVGGQSKPDVGEISIVRKPPKPM